MLSAVLEKSLNLVIRVESDHAACRCACCVLSGVISRPAASFNKKNLEKNLGKLLTFKQLKQKLDKLMQNLR